MEKAARWLFADRNTGAITIAQAPNLSLWIFLGASAASAVVQPIASIAPALRVVAGASLGLWALDEALRGVNPWRRGLGATVLIFELIHSM